MRNEHFNVMTSVNVECEREGVNLMVLERVIFK